jgi:Flp pilus assembly protein TadB
VNRPSPPKLALALLNRFGPQDDVLTGDLIEEFASGRSRWWFWQQTMSAVATEAGRRDREIRPLRLVEDESLDGTVGSRGRTRPGSFRMPVNITGTPVAGVGGLGVAVLAGLVTFVVPQVWWIVAGVMAAGLAFGVLLLTAGRHRMNTRQAAAVPTLLSRDVVDNRSSCRIDRQP